MASLIVSEHQGTNKTLADTDPQASFSLNYLEQEVTLKRLFVFNECNTAQVSALVCGSLSTTRRGNILLTEMLLKVCHNSHSRDIMESQQTRAAGFTFVSPPSPSSFLFHVFLRV